MILCISVVSLVISFSLLILFIWVFSSPLLSESSQRFVSFTFSKNQLLVLWIFSYCFLNLCVIDFLFELYDFLPFAEFRVFFFVLLILIHLGGGLSCLFEIFLLFWGRPALLWISLTSAFVASHRFWVVGSSLSIVLRYFLISFLS